jgi:serine/threonine protein kinase
MSPEQTRRDVNQIDGRSDLFSLGVTFYKMLTGKLPFDSPSGNASEILLAIQNRTPQPMRQLNALIPPSLEPIVLRLLAKEPNDRYPSAQDLFNALQETLNSLGGQPCSTESSTEEFLLIVQSRDEQWVSAEKANAIAYFDNQPNPIPPHSMGAIVAVDPNMNLDGALWRELLERTLQALNSSRSQGKLIHLVPRINTLCAFELGTRMNNQFPCQLYHCQQSQLFPLWKVDRSVKDGRSPHTQETAVNQFFDSRTIPSNSNSVSSSPTAICLAFEVGANPLLPEVTQWRDAAKPEAAIVLFTQRHKQLRPDDTAAWIAAAVEISRSIKQCEEDDLYLFLDMPASLALMAGDALGNWSGKQIHLMQYLDRRDRNEQLPYLEVSLH